VDSSLPKPSSDDHSVSIVRNLGFCPSWQQKEELAADLFCDFVSQAKAFDEGVAIVETGINPRIHRNLIPV